MGATKATALPSGEIAGDSSIPRESVSRWNLTLDAGACRGCPCHHAAPKTIAASSAPASIDTARRVAPVGGAGGAAVRPSSSSSCASPTSRRRRERSWRRQRSSRTRTDGGVAAGNPSSCGSPRRISAIVSDAVFPANSRRPVRTSYSTQPNAQMSLRRSTARRGPARGSCRRLFPARGRLGVSASGVVGEVWSAELSLTALDPWPGRSRAASRAPSGVSLTLAGLRSR